MSHHGRTGMGLGLALLLGIILAVGSCGVYINEYSTPDTVTLHITGKESVNTGEGHEYRVYTEEETYVIKDNLLWGNFRSSNLYGSLPVPANGPGANPVAYRCEVAGWRIPLFSMFENIKKCEKLD